MSSGDRTARSLTSLEVVVDRVMSWLHPSALAREGTGGGGVGDDRSPAQGRDEGRPVIGHGRR